MLCAVAPAVATAAPAPWNRALLIQDEPTWGNSANQDVLDLLGVTYDEIGSAALATTDLTQYRAVIYSS
ncbi:MAG: hypothetical protein Q8K89_12820, partial [Actinomycetota bacterium]|nr:hypothetical protein [Actinomycetota bacterium]